MNSAQRFPQTQCTLPKGRSAGRVGNSAQRFPQTQCIAP